MDNMEKISETPKKKVSPEFRERLLELIDDVGCRRTEFSSLVKVNKDIISRATIYGIVPSMQSLLKIADYSEVSLEYLLGLKDKNEFYKSESPTTFHARLLQLTEEKGTTFAQIAHRMPFARNLFQEWLRRKTLPTLDNLLALAEYFKVSPEYLLGRTDDKN